MPGCPVSTLFFRVPDCKPLRRTRRISLLHRFLLQHYNFTNSSQSHRYLSVASSFESHSIAVFDHTIFQKFDKEFCPGRSQAHCAHKATTSLLNHLHSSLIATSQQCNFHLLSNATVVQHYRAPSPARPALETHAPAQILL